ncbi:MAG: M23 family metallopeptidase [Methylobacteriaceae bacterium]|nr:M23 family metallopeptidase [Methylobacteriaceae bacterium]
MGQNTYFSQRRAERASGLDLGLDPPINGAGRAIDFRGVSVRWLSGVVLTMFAGSALIGAAAYASLDRRSSFAEAPQAATPVRREPTGDPAVNPRKGDRLVKAVDIVAAKQTFRTPVAIRAGDKEVIRQRAFTRVATPLTVASTGFADDVPAFNPLRLMGDTQTAGAAQDAGPALDEAEVSFSTHDLDRLPQVEAGPALSAEEAAAQVAEQVRSQVASGAKPAIPLPPQLLLMRTSRVGLDPLGALSYARPDSPINAPFSSIEVRMVPENVTPIAKASAVAQPTQMEERLVIVRLGETLDDILKANGATRAQIRAIAAAFGARRNEQPVREGQKLRLLLADLDGAGGALQIARLNVYSDDKLEATIAVRDSGDYLLVDKPEPALARSKPRRPRAEDDEDDEDSGGMRIYNSLYETALKQEIPRPIIDELVRIFANEVDFQRSVAGGDSIDVFYAENEENENRNELLFASITTRDETFRYYRYQTPDDNVVDYYDESGRSVRKFLVRKPIGNAEMRSGFGMRFHPIMRYAKMHTGVDWAGPIGTPIVAAGSGVVLKASWDSGGYGRRVEIQHANGYITTYNHMSGFARGVVEGSRVRQGQVIGYLGSSGLSTGPHLHYEVMVNGHFVDPMRIKLTRTKEFDGRALADFRRERERIDQLMAKAPNAVAPPRLAQKR